MIKSLVKSQPSSINNQLDLLSLYLTCTIYNNIHKNTPFELFEYHIKTCGYYINIKYKGQKDYYTLNEKTFNSHFLKDKVEYIKFRPKYIGLNYMRVLKKEIRILFKLNEQ